MKKFKLRSRAQVAGVRGFGPVREYLILVDDDDAHWLRANPLSVNQRCGSAKRDYPTIKQHGVSQILGRVILGVTDEHAVVRYTDGNPMNCTRANMHVERIGYELAEEAA